MFADFLADVTADDALHRETLFNDAMKGDWTRVVEIYRRYSHARWAEITRTGDTLLHVAVLGGNSHVVTALLEVIEATKDIELLLERNKAGNTPLHLAAALGMVEMCRNISRMDPRLIIQLRRNKNGETPLFLAANAGKKDAFFVLQARIDDLRPRLGSGPEIMDYCRRSSDGNTILHRAIYGEHFELAFEIMDIYPTLVDMRNARGETALHLLATKPSAFKSGSSIRFLDGLIYPIIIVDYLKTNYGSSKGLLCSSEQKEQRKNLELPQNYGMCLDIFFIFKMVVNVLVGQRRERYAPQDDIEKGLQRREEEDADVRVGEVSGLPPNYWTCFDFLMTIVNFFLIVLGIAFRRVEKIRRMKQKHVHASQIMIELVQSVSYLRYWNDGTRPNVENGDLPNVPPKEDSPGDKEANKYNNPSNDKNARRPKIEPIKETPILLAAKTGIVEMVKTISEKIPAAIHDVDSHNRNIVLLAALHRQPHIYRYMLERREMREYFFGMVDKDGNTALHLAASVSETHPWNIPGSALQMHWEIKWYKYVENSEGSNFFAPLNNNAETARDVFTRSHEKLVTDGAKWLTDAFQSCSVVAALIATVAFASATTVPGGIKSDSGMPALEGQLAFGVFALSSLVALCFSVTSLVMFLSVTSRYQETDFESNLPMKLILGLTSLFMSIAAMMVAFCGAHFYLIANKLKYAALPLYVVVFIPVTLLAREQFPLYFDLIKATITHVPERIYQKQSL